jgi:hypothetical protein
MVSSARVVEGVQGKCEPRAAAFHDQVARRCGDRDVTLELAGDARQLLGIDGSATCPRPHKPRSRKAPLSQMLGSRRSGKCICANGAMPLKDFAGARRNLSKRRDSLRAEAAAVNAIARGSQDKTMSASSHRIARPLSVSSPRRRPEASTASIIAIAARIEEAVAAERKDRLHHGTWQLPNNTRLVSGNATPRNDNCPDSTRLASDQRLPSRNRFGRVAGPKYAA